MNGLNTMTSEFVGRISVAVWIGRLSDDAAREALGAYAATYRRVDSAYADSLHEAILAEYRHRREGQELCS
jgi:predicted secreted protein